MTQRSTASIPPLSSAHQARLQAIVEQMRDVDIDDADRRLLEQVVRVLPSLRATQQREAQEVLQHLDQNELLLAAAIGQLEEARQALANVLDASGDVSQMMIDGQRLGTFAERVLAVAQSAGEAALRAEERAELIKRCSNA